MRRTQRPWWLVGTISLVTVAACGSTSPTHTATPRATPTGATTPTANVTATRFLWKQVATPSAPLARNSAGFAYDAATGTDILTGGRTGCSPSATQYLDTWSWNGTAWTQLPTGNNSPGAMAWFTMAYDDATGQEIAVGAYSGCGIATGMLTWSGSQWTSSPQTLKLPDVLVTYSLAYDAASRTMILFGDSAGNSDAQPATHLGPETWSWNGSHWTYLPAATSPPALRDPAMAYDAATHDIVLFGGAPVSTDGTTATFGSPTAETWLWNGSTWTEASTASAPPARYGASMAFDPELSANVLFGGVTGDVMTQPPSGPVTVYDDMWTWNGTTWAQLRPALVPLGRFYSQMTYDSTHHELVLFGGSLNAHADANDTWVFRSS